MGRAILTGNIGSTGLISNRCANLQVGVVRILVILGKKLHFHSTHFPKIPPSSVMSVPRLRCFLSAIMLAATPLLLQAEPGKMYWSDRGSGQIFVANFDGSGQQEILNDEEIPGSNRLRGLTEDPDSGDLFFCDSSAGKIFRFNPFTDDEAAELVTGLGFPADVTLHPVEKKIYWCHRNGDKIQRADLDGSNVEDVVTDTKQPYFLSLDLTEGKVYWGDFAGGNVFRANSVDGSDQETLVSGITGRTRGVHYDPVEEKIYWVNRNDGIIQRRDIGGGVVDDLYTGLDTPHGMTLDLHARKVYWADTGTNSNDGTGARRVSRGDMDGSGPQEILSIDGASHQPWDVILDLRPGTYEQWQARYFRMEDNSESKTKTGDPDLDGTENFVEYVLGWNPTKLIARESPHAVVGDDGGFRLEVLRNGAEPPDGDVVVEQSADLTQWSASDVEIESTSEVGSGWIRETYRINKGNWSRIRALPMAK